MSRLELYAESIVFNIGDVEAFHEDGNVRVALGLGDGYPSLEFDVNAHPRGKPGAYFCLNSYEEIDALRRYCEMALELFSRAMPPTEK